MNARTRVRICKLIEKLDKHPELAEKLGIRNTLTTNAEKKRRYENEKK